MAHKHNILDSHQAVTLLAVLSVLSIVVIPLYILQSIFNPCFAVILVDIRSNPGLILKKTKIMMQIIQTAAVYFNVCIYINKQIITLNLLFWGSLYERQLTFIALKHKHGQKLS